MKKKAIILIVLIAMVSIGLIGTGIYLFYTVTNCPSESCFNNALVNCKRVSYFKDGAETSLSYKILGKSEGTCKVEVKLVQFKQGTSDLSVLEGKSMICSTSLGTLVEPEKNLGSCHGILKEEIQEMIIKRLHAQIVENLGKISEETTKII